MKNGITLTDIIFRPPHSLLVDELARCKAILSCRCQEARDALQTLTEEHKRFMTELRELNGNLKKCQYYVDGVRSKNQEEDDQSRFDLQCLVSECNMRSSLVSRSLRDRQMYNEARSRPNSPECRRAQAEDSIPMTPGQTMAAKVSFHYKIHNYSSSLISNYPINHSLTHWFTEKIIESLFSH
jgi:hypothetical protein